MKCLFPNNCNEKYKCCGICKKLKCENKCYDNPKNCKYVYENTNDDYTKCPRPKATTIRRNKDE